jgi:transcription initiation factor IIE alpha subunit
MAVSSCPKCGGHAFERGLITPLKELRAVSVLQCAGCGTVVGTLDASAAIEGLQKQIAAIDAGLVRIIEAL